MLSRGLSSRLFVVYNGMRHNQGEVLNMGQAFLNGWVMLPCGADLLLEHGIPVRVWAGEWEDINRAHVVADIQMMSSLHVHLADAVDADGELAVQVSCADIPEMLRRLAMVSAATFVDRYQKPIGEESADYDEEAFAQDMSEVLARCGLQWSDVDRASCRQTYSDALHAAADALVPH